MFNQEGSTARRFIYSAVFWLIIPITYGLLLALHLWKPDLIFPWLNPLHLSFGRLRPMHVNTAARRDVLHHPPLDRGQALQ